MLGCGASKDDTAATTATASECTPDQLATHTKGQLTIATDEPAYEPYFVDDEPANGKGFESAVGYAIGETLGFEQGRSSGRWSPSTPPTPPGPKDFDFDLNQISITPVREKAVDFSAPYYTADQAIVALKDSDAAKATTLADLEDAEIGVQIGTTSQEAVEDVIDPSTEVQVFNNSNDVVTALKNGQVEAIALDAPTAFELIAVEVPTATVVGQFSAPGGDQWGALLAKGSSLTACVSNAVEELPSLRRARSAQQAVDEQGHGRPRTPLVA